MRAAASASSGHDRIVSETGATRTAPPRAAVIGIAAAAALNPLNSTMIAVALPTIAREFDISSGDAGILVTLYLLAMLAGQPLAGRIGDAVGNRRMVIVALTGCGAGCLLAALAPTFGLLVAARLVQAVFAAALAPSVQSILRAITPPEQHGRTFGMLGSVIGVGAAGGPVIGGVLTSLFGWEAIFLVNLPIIAATLVVVARLSLVEHPTGLGRVGGGPRPKVEGRTFGAALVAQGMSASAQYALLLVSSIVLDERGWSSGTRGLALSALTFGLIVMGPTGGRLGDVVGRRAPVTAGLSAGVLAAGILAFVGPGVHAAALITALAFFGCGLGFATPGIMTAAIAAAPRERTGSAAGLLSSSRYVGSTISTIAISLLVDDRAHGVRPVLYLCLGTMTAALIAARFLPGRRPAPLSV